MSWLDEIVKSHEELESPISFWKWSALSAISAVVKDNVWIDRQIFKTYLNIYVMLHADSGLKKGPPINLAKKLVTEVGNTRVITGRSSIQGILKELGQGYTTEDGQVINKAVAFICSSELTSSIVEDKVATTILTDLYDRNYNEGNWRSLLKMESFSLKDPTLTLLSATNEAHSESFFLKQDVQGGYFARTFIIYENRRNRINALIKKLKNPPDYKKLAEYLKQIAKLHGPFEDLDGTEAGEYFDKWYTDLMQSIEDNNIKDDTGTLNRFGESVLKVAGLISLSEEPCLRISKSAMIRAIEFCEQLIGNVRKTTMARGKSTFAPQKAQMINELLSRTNHMITRAQLNKKYWMQATAAEWDDIASSLEVAGIIKVESHGNQIVYVMPEAQVIEWQKHLKGK